MILFLLAIFTISIILIFQAMIGYPLSILVIGKRYKTKKVKLDNLYQPTVAVMIVAHNEEKVIENKLKNILEIDYPKDKLSIYIASDSSTDKTNDLVIKFINEHLDRVIVLHKTKTHKGKTNAQNETQKLIDSEILVMTDANAILKNDAIKNLVAEFVDPQVAYATGCLKYINGKDNITASTESFYWDLELSIRNIESAICSVTAGNGAIYACRNKEYIVVEPIRCHDSAMPFEYALLGRKSVNCANAIAYEKAGETNADEYKRKVRMNRGGLNIFKRMYAVCNVFRFGWFSYFYFCHQFLRHILWLLHILLLLSNIGLAMYSKLWIFILICHLLILATPIFVKKDSNRIFRFLSYYVMTVFSQLHAVYLQILGKSSCTWEKAESTR